MTTLIQAAAELAQPWADLYGGSTLVQSGVAFLHLAGLLVAGGFALSADRGVLRHARAPRSERMAFVRELAATHRVVIAGLCVVVASGMLLLAADVEALLPSPVFWAKMGGFALLLVNGVSLQRAERAASDDVASTAADRSPDASPPGDPARPGGDERRWEALRAASLRSAGLWFAVLFLGTLLTAAA